MLYAELCIIGLAKQFVRISRKMLWKTQVNFLANPI